MPKRAFTVEGLYRPIGRGYSQVVRAGDFVFVAGQVALDEQGNLVGEGDIVAQSEQVYRNLSRALEAAGAGLQDLVKITTYLTRPQDLEGYRQVRLKYLGDREPPVSTLVIISQLVDPRMLVEVEGIAYTGRA